MDDKKFKNLSEDWQMDTQSIRERGKYLLDNALWTDCKFLVGTEESNKEFKAHKLILSMSSPVFAAMFGDDWPEIQPSIKIVDVQPEAFKSMLEYIYTDIIHMDTLDQACELCYVAKKYMLPHLLKNCMEFIWKDIDCHTALRAYEFAKLFEDPGILDKSMKIITEKTTDILSNVSESNMSMQTLLDILDQDQLNIPSEVYLFNMVQSWVISSNETENEKYNVEKIRSFARPALEKIRFLVMDVSDFAEGPAESPLLTKDESYAILLNISSPRSKVPLPDNFSENRIPRTLSRKLYMERPIRKNSARITNGCMADELTFTASDNVMLLGIQISVSIFANYNKDIDLFLFIKKLQYSENTCFSHFTSLIPKSTDVMFQADIMFQSPAFIEQNEEYKLGVTLSKGSFDLASFSGPMTVSSDDVSFFLSNNVCSAFISSLIFTH